MLIQIHCLWHIRLPSKAYSLRDIIILPIFFGEKQERGRERSFVLHEGRDHLCVYVFLFLLFTCWVLFGFETQQNWKKCTSKCPQKYVLKTHKNSKVGLVFFACNFDRVRCCLLSWTNLVKLKTIVQASNLEQTYSSGGAILYLILFLTFILLGLDAPCWSMQKKNSGSMCDKILEHLPIIDQFWCT